MFWVLFKLLLLCWVLGQVSVPTPFKNGISTPYSPVVLLDISPLVFNTKLFGSLFVSVICQVLVVEVPGWGVQTSCFSGRNSKFVRSSRLWVTAWRGSRVGGLLWETGFDKTLWIVKYKVQYWHVSLPLPSVLMWSSTSVFRVFLEGIISCVAVDLLCPWEGVKDLFTLPPWTTSLNSKSFLFLNSLALILGPNLKQKP